MDLQVTNPSPSDPNGLKLKIVCPRCRHAGTFDSVANIQDLALPQGMPLGSGSEGTLLIGHRMCPDPACRQHVVSYWLARPGGGELLQAVPPLLVDFDASDIPADVVAALGEAIKCHSIACYKAAAMMIRKALELLCQAQGVSGGTLKQRVAELETKIMLPRELIEGLDTLRVLGNDAAHVEARAYDEIAASEVETAIEFTKEVLKACYQYRRLVERMRPRQTLAE